MTFRPCVVVPVFNHGREAEVLIPRLLAHGLVVIVVDDGSEGECAARLDALAARHPKADILRHPSNQGKGAAVLTGLTRARELGFTHALQIDADGQHDVGDVPRLLAIAADNPEALICGRPKFDASAPYGRRVARNFCNLWVWIETLSLQVRDAMCGFRVYPLEPVMKLATQVRLGRRMDFDPEIIVRLIWDNVATVSVATRVTYPVGGRSNFRLVHDNWLLTKLHTRLVFGMLRRSPDLFLRKMGFRRTGRVRIA